MRKHSLDTMRKLSNLKVCFLAGTLEHGGAERQLYYILQALCMSGATPRLLSMDQGQFWENTIKSLGVRVTYVGGRPSRLARLLRVMKEVRKDPPQVLQSQHFFTNAYAGLAARQAGISGVGAMRNDGRSEVRESGPFGGWLNLRVPRIIAANSQIAIQYAIAKGVPASTLYFLPNVVDTDWFKPAGPGPKGPLTLIAVGRLVKQKRLDRFISILGRLRSEFGLDVRGLIVGPGCQTEDLRPELESQARKLGLLPDFVQFRGGVSDMRPVYQEAAICVLTSDFEGTPNVLLEAMASGLPVVATNVGGVPGIVRHGQTGFVMEPDDLEGLIAAIVELVKHSELRTTMAQRARAYVEENHSLHRLPTYLGGLYQLAIPTLRPSIAGVVEQSSI
jgi:glycosyltransferase involved in cell wall biosynthesis